MKYENTDLRVVLTWVRFAPNRLIRDFFSSDYNTFWLVEFNFVTNSDISYSELKSLSIRHQGCQIWHPNWVRLVPNGRHLGLFKISFSIVWLGSQHVMILILKSSSLFHIGAILTLFGCHI